MASTKELERKGIISTGSSRAVVISRFPGRGTRKTFLSDFVELSHNILSSRKPFPFQTSRLLEFLSRRVKSQLVTQELFQTNDIFHMLLENMNRISVRFILKYSYILVSILHCKQVGGSNGQYIFRIAPLPHSSSTSEETGCPEARSKRSYEILYSSR